jgi:hypothetical protein
VTGKTFGQRPSDLLRVEDEWAALCLDNAVSFFGNYIESKLLEVDSKGKQKHSLSDLLSDNQAASLEEQVRRLASIFGVIKVRNGKRADE